MSYWGKYVPDIAYPLRKPTALPTFGIWDFIGKWNGYPQAPGGYGFGLATFKASLFEINLLDLSAAQTIPFVNLICWRDDYNLILHDFPAELKPVIKVCRSSSHSPTSPLVKWQCDTRELPRVQILHDAILRFLSSVPDRLQSTNGFLAIFIGASNSFRYRSVLPFLNYGIEVNSFHLTISCL